MLYKCTDLDKSTIFQYIGKNYKNCLYAYADLCRYSLGENFINAWLEYSEEGKIRALIFNYHNGVHIYSSDLSFDIDEVVNLLKTIKPAMINAKIEIIHMLASYFEEYHQEFGYILHQENKEFKYSENVEPANPSDFHDMASMLCEDYGIGASYTLEEMEKQIKERYIDGYGRSYILRKDDVIAAQASTGAEVKEFAVIIYVIVANGFRRQGLASEVTGNLCQTLLNEGKDIYLVCYEEGAMLMYERLGFKPCTEWGKLFIERV